MTKQEVHTPFDYAGKYAEAGRIGGRLVDGFFRSVASLCERSEPRSVLEVGCGEGFSTRRIRAMLPTGATLSALDVEKRLVEAAARRNPDVPIGIGSICDLQQADDSLDLVLALEVLEHLEQPRRALSELQRVSRHWVITSVPREPLWRFLNLCRLKYLTEFGNTPGHLQHWSTGAFLGLVREYGEVLAVRKPLPWTVVLWKPYAAAPQAAP